MNRLRTVLIEGIIEAADVLPEGHVDEVVDTAADCEAEVTEGPQGGDPGGTGGEVILKGRANEIYNFFLVTRWSYSFVFFQYPLGLAKVFHTLVSMAYCQNVEIFTNSDRSTSQLYHSRFVILFNIHLFQCMSSNGFKHF